MKKNYKIAAIITTLIAVFICNIVIAHAQTTDRLKNFGSKAGYETSAPKEPAAVAGEFLTSALSYIGIISIILFVYAGFLWMTAGGNTKKVDTAKQIIFNTIIGLAVIFGAFAIVMTVIRVVAPGGA